MNDDALSFEDPRPGPLSDFQMLFEQFKGTRDGVLEVLDTASPHVASLDDGAGSLTVRIPRGPASEAFANALAMQSITVEEPQAPGESKPVQIPPGSGRQIGEALVETLKDEPEALRAFGKAIVSVNARPRRQQLLNASLLTLAVGSLETAAAGVATQHFVLHPDAVSDDEKEFSLADLAEFAELADAREMAISRRVETVMRGGFDSWDKWLCQLLGGEKGSFAVDQDVLVEAIQRRHLVIHNAGRVSRQYLAKAPPCDYDVGDELVIDSEYLSAALDAIAVFGVRLILVAWVRWLPQFLSDALELANEFIIGELDGGRNLVAASIAATAHEFADNEQIRLFLQVNEWQARKRLVSLEVIRAEVEAWDTSALSPLFSAARSALLDDFDSLFAEIPDLIAQEVLLPGGLRSWPLFKEARASDRWSDVEALLEED